MYSVKNGCGIFDLEHTMIKHYYNTYIFHYNASTSVVINKKKNEKITGFYNLRIRGAYFLTLRDYNTYIYI